MATYPLSQGICVAIPIENWGLGFDYPPVVDDGCNKAMPSSLQAIEFTTLFGSEDKIP